MQVTYVLIIINIDTGSASGCCARTTLAKQTVYQ